MVGSIIQSFIGAAITCGAVYGMLKPWEQLAPCYRVLIFIICGLSAGIGVILMAA